MANKCLAAIHLCRVRVTRLDATGHPVAGPNNSYVTDKPMVLNVTPQVETGQDKTLVGGCDCIVAEYRGFDKLKRFDFELDLAVLEPALIEMLTGASAITVGGATVGNWFPTNQFSCSGVIQPNVCVEGWQDGWSGDSQDATFPYIHWVWPSSYWQISALSLQNDFNQPKITGFSRANPNWGTGIYADQPEAAGALGGWFYTATVPPTASCDYKSQAIT